MKKFVSLLLVVLMIASVSVVAIIPVSAAADQNKYGDVKKVSDSDINMSDAMNTEPAWANALAIPLTRNSADDATAAHGTVYLLWSDTAYYAFYDITDTTIMGSIGKAEAQSPWIEDSCEFFIDADNAGTFCDQFRVDTQGVPSYYPDAGAWPDDMKIGVTDISGLDPVPANYMSWAVKVDKPNNKYYIKMKITFYSSVTAKDVGVNFQLNDVTDADGTMSNTWAAGNEATSWDVNLYGYVTLVNDPAYVAPVTDVAAPADTNAPAAVADTAAPVAATPISAPITGDNSLAIFAVMVIAAAGVVIFRKKMSVK
ncbi:MAG: CBM9 family sugar-binding protein [Oscillospiraceae bacterium]|nr:CBM9 family sugar-binding protein [Oscillospiraceae bacterium]